MSSGTAADKPRTPAANLVSGNHGASTSAVAGGCCLERLVRQSHVHFRHFRRIATMAAKSFDMHQSGPRATRAATPWRSPSVTSQFSCTHQHVVALARPLLASWRLCVRTKCSVLPHAKTQRRQDPDWVSPTVLINEKIFGLSGQGVNVVFLRFCWF